MRLRALVLTTAVAAAVFVGMPTAARALEAGKPAGSKLDQAAAAAKRGDDDEAYRLYKALADQGNAEAQYRMARMNLQPDRFKGYAAVIPWYRKAAEQGHAEAQFQLGWHYQEALGVDLDETLAADWIRKAADQGHAEAQSFLGMFYALGRGVKRDYVQAYKWFDLSSASGFKAGSMSRDRIAGKMTPAQISEAQRLVREFKPS